MVAVCREYLSLEILSVRLFKCVKNIETLDGWPVRGSTPSAGNLSQ